MTYATETEARLARALFLIVCEVEKLEKPPPGLTKALAESSRVLRSLHDPETERTPCPTGSSSLHS